MAWMPVLHSLLSLVVLDSGRVVNSLQSHCRVAQMLVMHSLLMLLVFIRRRVLNSLRSRCRAHRWD